MNPPSSPDMVSVVVSILPKELDVNNEQHDEDDDSDGGVLLDPCL
jgi:hypothetical protein